VIGDGVRVMGESLIGIVTDGEGEGAERTDLVFDLSGGQLLLDRRASGVVELADTFPRVTATPLPVQLTDDGGRARARVLVDSCSIEVFAGDGEAALSALVLPRGDERGVRVTAAGGSASLHWREWPLDAAAGGRA